jgi:N4-gp56 family major capsid protein
LAVQTYNGLSAEQKTFYDRLLLERLLPDLYFLKYGDKRPIPRNEGATINIRRFESLTPVTTSNLTGANEGVTPADSALTITTVTATVAGYGAVMRFSDFIDMAAIDRVITESIELLTENANTSVDSIIQAVVAAGTNVYYVNGEAGRGSIQATDTVSGLDIRKARRIMRNNNVKPYDGRNYIGFVHPYVAYDLMSDPAWTNANQYAGAEQIFEGELGKIYGVRFLETTQAPVFTGAGVGGINVYGTLVTGRGAYAVPDIAGSSKPEVIYQPFGSGGPYDPLNQQATVGWKAYLTSARQNELCILRIESAASS